MPMEKSNMKIVQVTPGLIPIPPNGWGAIEKLIWELHCNFLKAGHDSKIVYLDEITGNEDIVHIHVGNLANTAHERGIPYYFTMSDHYTHLYGKASGVYQANLKAVQNSIRSFVGGKFLVDYFDGIPEYSPYGVNTKYFTPAITKPKEHRLLCVANNGYETNPSGDRKGFGHAIAAAKRLGLPITIAGPKNNQIYFDSNPPDYDKLTILYDLTEEQLLQTYREHTIFLHPSHLEAGHPNLTLLEAMACGLPVVGTFEENNSLRGMQIVNPTGDEVADGINTVLENYNGFVDAALSQAEELSWENRAKEFLNIYTEDKSGGSTMKRQLLNHYSNTNKLKKSNSPKITIHNVDGMFVEILGGPVTEYEVKFIDRSTNETVYTSVIGSNCWARTSAKYYVDWKVQIRDLNSTFTYEYDLNLAGKKVFICFESKSLGDTLAWIPFVEEFRKKHNCELICSTFLNKLFASKYPNIKFVEPAQTVHDLTALYRLGVFYKDNEIDTTSHPSYPMNKPLQQMASDILGLPYKEIRPEMVQPEVDVDEKLITIGIHSTAQAKYWNNPEGWQDVVNYLNNKGYTVKLLSNEPDGYMGNKHPHGIISHPASSLESAITELKKSKLFIGLASGLSWVSWAVGTPTMIISGFSDPVSEMQECIRIAAPVGSCRGCFGRHKLDAGDWNWCPDHKDTPRQFECSKNISSQTVIDTIERFLNNTPTNLPGWFSYQGLYDEMVDNAVGGETFVEVGAWMGKSTNYMATKISDSQKDIKFTTIDTWKGTPDESYHINTVDELGGDMFPQFIKNTVLSNNHTNIQTIKDTSLNAANLFANNSIDFIMIDAGHSYTDVLNDLNIWYNKVKPGGIISGDDYTVFGGVTRAADEFFYGQFKHSGYSFIRKKPRIQIKHMLTRPDDLRERISVKSIEQLERYGIKYEQIINKVYDELPPKEHCARPEHIVDHNTPGEIHPGAGLGWLTGRHYGCYLAHRTALETIDDVNYDYTLIFEADAYLYVGLEEFVDIVHKACFISERDDVYYISFANNGSHEIHHIAQLFSRTAFNQNLAHCYLIPNRYKQWWLDRLADCPWDVADIWFNHVFHQHPKPRYTTNKIYSKQAGGMSLIDKELKT